MSDETTHPDPNASWSPTSGLRDDTTPVLDDPAESRARATFGPDDDPVVTIVELVAAVTDRDVTDMPPLFECVDPEALGALVGSPRVCEQPITIGFTYQRCEITVSSDGDVIVDVPSQ